MQDPNDLFYYFKTVKSKNAKYQVDLKLISHATHAAKNKHLLISLRKAYKKTGTLLPGAVSLCKQHYSVMYSTTYYSPQYSIFKQRGETKSRGKPSKTGIVI